VIAFRGQIACEAYQAVNLIFLQPLPPFWDSVIFGKLLSPPAICRTYPARRRASMGDPGGYFAE
jgi:hypothetical protein